MIGLERLNARIGREDCILISFHRSYPKAIVTGSRIFESSCPSFIIFSGLKAANAVGQPLIMMDQAIHTIQYAFNY